VPAATMLADTLEAKMNLEEGNLDRAEEFSDKSRFPIGSKAARRARAIRANIRQMREAAAGQ